jgi:RNA polymerase sigma-70 factor (ECF subfamily)
MASPSAPDDIFSAWMAEHGGILERVARSQARDERERADLARELAYQVWLSVPRFAGAARPSTWIYRVCLNTALTWRRDRTRREGRIDADADVALLPAGAPDPAAGAERGDLLTRVYAALRALPEPDRALLLLQLDGLPHRDIAEILGLTENHVGVAVHRARQRLTRHLKGILHELE